MPEEKILVAVDLDKLNQQLKERCYAYFTCGVVSSKLGFKDGKYNNTNAAQSEETRIAFELLFNNEKLKT